MFARMYVCIFGENSCIMQNNVDAHLCLRYGQEAYKIGFGRD